MKKTLALVVAVLAASLSLSLAQTPQEIVARMDETFSGKEAEGISLRLEMKLPIIGTVATRIGTRGDKTRIEGEYQGVTFTSWTDETTTWTYSPKENELTITPLDLKNKKESDAQQDNLKMLDDVTQGYDLSLKDETDAAWHILCTRSRSNKDKDAPKTMDLYVAKGSYFPLSLSTKKSGVTIKMSEFKFGISEREVTFHPEDIPADAKITDKR